MPHAFITGAAKRVGRHLALTLAHAGYDLTLHYRNSRTEAEQLAAEIAHLPLEWPVCCHLIQADLSEPIDADAMIGESIEALGPLHLLIHNASRFERDDLEHISQEQIHEHIQVNMAAPVLLSSAYYKAHEVLEIKPQQDSIATGHILCLLDGMHGWSISTDFLSYTLSKHALEQFIHLSASSFAPTIRINGIALGATLPGHMDHASTFDKTRILTPLKRNSAPQEVAEAMMLLERSPSMTGQILYLSGGMHVLQRRT